jgi:hypothetical protein
MHLATRAGSRRRTWRALLAVALPAVIAVVALPAAATAAVVEEAPNGTLQYRAASGEINSLSVSDPDRIRALEIRDLTGLTSRTPLCAQVSTIRIRCAIGIRLGEARLGDRNDTFAISASTPIVVDGGTGNDSYTAGTAPGISQVEFRGGANSDHVSYSQADRGVRISNDGAANDGRIGLDFDNIRTDVEQLDGSRFGDEITGVGDATVSCCQTDISGGQGNDVLRAAGGAVSTLFDMGRVADGADRIIGGSGGSTVLYEDRSRPVNVTLNFGGADDGEAGERDEITGSNEAVFGGQAGDTIRAPAGSIAAHMLIGNGGGDTVEGANGSDFLVGNQGGDTIVANGGDDDVFAADGEGDIVGCGPGTDDTAQLDPNTVDVSSSCENRSVIGTLRLTPKTLTAKAGKPARMRLSWRHPISWRKLRALELRLTQRGAPVGEVTIRPRGERISADGAVELVRRHSRLSHKGKTVAARLAIRLDESVTAQALTAEVEAIDTRGRRQLERDAATVRVAR